MKKEIVLGLTFFILAFVLLLGIAVADFNYGSNEIEKDYIGGSAISGTLNISFDDESANSLLTSNFDGSIKLIDFLNKNGLIEGEDFDCDFNGCSQTYKPGASATSFSLVSNENKTLGFKITGIDIRVIDAKLNIGTNAPISCSRAFVADVLANNTYKIQNLKYVNETCGASLNGCFSDSGNIELAEIGSSPYCEKIKLPSAPAFNLGAEIASTSGSGVLKMELYNSEWDFVDSCTLPSPNAPNQKIKCIADYPVFEEGDYYVCVSIDSGSAEYSIKTEQEGSVCGYSDANTDEVDRDFNVFAEPLKYDSAGLNLNETVFYDVAQESLAGIFDNYIVEKYSRDCTGDGCFIPIELNSGISQDIVVSNVEIRYQSKNATTLKNSNFYFGNKVNASISSGYLTLDLEKSGLAIPVTTKNKYLQLYLNGQAILPKQVTIAVTPGFTFDVNPKNVYVGIENNFKLYTSANLSSIKWNFGDGSPDVTTTNNVVAHRYTEEGEYELLVDATRKDGVSVKKTFTIFSGNATLSASSLIDKYQKNIVNLSLQIAKYDSWIKNALNEKINLSNMNSSLAEIKSDFESGADATDTLGKLIALDVPDEISVQQTGKLPLDIGFNNIDSSIAENIEGNSSASGGSEELKQGIINWNSDNYNLQTDFNVFVKKSGSVSEPIFTQFKVNIEAKNQKSGNLVINYPQEEIIFKTDYGERAINSEISSATAIVVSGNKVVEFLLPGEVEVSELGAYIAPPLSEISIVNEPAPLVGGNPRPGVAKWLYIVLIVGVLLVYIILQEWYKKRYEAHLFSNRDDLYNLVNFISNSRISQMNDGDIRKKLATYNWKGEQITYAFKKIDGRRTGMWEIPIFKFLENRKVKQEIEKRQQSGNARFIKSPYQ